MDLINAEWTIVVLNDKTWTGAVLLGLDLGKRQMNNCRLKRQKLNRSSTAWVWFGKRRMNNCRFKRQNLNRGRAAWLNLDCVGTFYNKINLWWLLCIWIHQASSTAKSIWTLKVADDNVWHSKYSFSYIECTTFIICIYFFKK